ncbi:hypothetical protein ACA910_000519 [Epithemia clementina (nom. ined.)]
MARYPIYQIDFSAVSAGKHVASTKRRIKWRFGFPNEEALAEGQTGTACRGEEHDVVVVWSITSGKRQIMMDGKEVHYSTNRTNVLEHSWTSRGNHIVKVLCHATPPMTATPGFRQYDLFVDGQSFFTMPKMYELGLRSGSRDHRGGGGGIGTRSAYPPPGSVKAPKSEEEEQEDLQRAIRASLEESRAHLEQRAGGPPTPAPVPPPAPPALTDGDDLMSLGMGDPTVPGYDNGYGASAYQQPQAYQQQPGYQQPPMYEQSYQQPPAAPVYPTSNAGAGSYPALPASPAQDPGYYAQQPPAASPYGAAPVYGAPVYGAAPSYVPASPAPQSSTLLTENYTPNPSGPADLYDSYASEDPFAPKAAPPATHSQKANEILSAYASPSQMPGGYGSPDLKTGNDLALVTTNGSSPGSMAMMNFEEEEPLNPFDAALKKLVNVDHIDQPAEVHLAVKKKENEADTMKKKGKSKGLPPAAHQVVGGQATLAQISEVKPKKAPKEDIMKPPPQLFSADAQQAGMMVVYGQPNQQQGPPALQPQGFGVGFSQPGYGAQPGYGPQPGYGAQPGYGPQPGYAAQPPRTYY